MKRLFVVTVLILGIVLIPKNTFALEYTASDGKVYQVTDAESLRDYHYFTYVYNYGVDRDLKNNSNFYMFEDSSNYCLGFGQSNQKSNGIYPKTYLIENDTRYFAHLSCSNSTNYQLYGWSCYNKSTFDYVSISPPLRFQKDTYTLLYYTFLTNSSNCSIENGEHNITYEEIENKYLKPVESEEIGMFDVVETFLVQFVNILPFIIPFILIMNLICRMLFNERS